MTLLRIEPATFQSEATPPTTEPLRPVLGQNKGSNTLDKLLFMVFTQLRYWKKQFKLNQ